MYAALGCGALKITQILAKVAPPLPHREKTIIKAPLPEKQSGEIFIEGVGDLLTQIAKCCKPVLGDPIIGYITLGKGISIHRKDCSNILHIAENLRKKLIAVSWGYQERQNHSVNVRVEAYDRQGLLHDLTALITHEKTNISFLNSTTEKSTHRTLIDLTLEIDKVEALSQLLDQIKMLPNVIEARRM